MTVEPFATAVAAPVLPEVERFLAPISEERPAGEWLRFDPLYDEVKLLREQDDPTLPQGVWQRELKRADWSGVAALCVSALESRTKDLQLAAWMTEAWIHIHGFPGLERGLRVLAALCRTFWNDVHPAIEEGSTEARLSPIAWAAEKLVLPMKSIPVTDPAGEQAMAYAWRDWETALYLANLAKTAPAANVPERAVTQSKFLVSVSLTPAALFVALEHDLVAASAALDDLDRALTERLGESGAPSLTPLRTPLSAMQAFVGRIRAERAERGEIPMASMEAPPAGEEESMSTEAAPSSPHGPITNRIEAYQRLREAADYLMRTEPHSPVPYLVRRAISWGNLSLAELLEELLQKNADLATINALLGIRKS